MHTSYTFRASLLRQTASFLLLSGGLLAACGNDTVVPICAGNCSNAAGSSGGEPVEVPQPVRAALVVHRPGARAPRETVAQAALDLAAQQATAEPREQHRAGRLAMAVLEGQQRAAAPEEAQLATAELSAALQ